MKSLLSAPASLLRLSVGKTAVLGAVVGLMLLSGCGSAPGVPYATSPAGADPAVLQTISSAVHDGLYYQDAALGTNQVALTSNPQLLSTIADRYRILAGRIEAACNQNPDLASYDGQVQAAQQEDATVLTAAPFAPTALVDVVLAYQSAFKAIDTNLSARTYTTGTFGHSRRIPGVGGVF